MPTHKNCFELVKEVRQELNEYDDALATGDDTTGAVKNPTIIARINAAIRELYAFICKRRPGEFLQETSLTAVSSVLTLPSNFGRLVLLRTSDGYKVWPIDQVERRLTGDDGSQYAFYQKGRTLLIDKANDASTYTLIYLSKPRDIHQGKASAGGTNSITLDSKYAPKTADHYVGMTLEDVTGDWASEISAYTAARVATVSGTAAAGDFYALVPEIPEWAHHLIAPRAAILLKHLPQSRESVSRAELENYKELLITTMREFAAPDDQDYEELFFTPEPRNLGIWI
jgi:hypothetical protein